MKKEVNNKIRRIKPLLPSLREKKRYVAFEIISDRPIGSFKAVQDAVWSGALEFLGVLGCAEAGLMIFENKYDLKTQRGLIKTSHKSLEKIRATMTLLNKIDNQDVIFKSLGTSGIMKKAEEMKCNQ